LFDGGGDQGYDSAPVGNGYRTSILDDIDVNDDNMIGNKPFSSYDAEGTYDFGDFPVDPGASGFEGSNPSPGLKDPKQDNSKPFWQNPAFLAAAIQSGAGLLGGMNQMDLQKAALKAQQEKEKMNQMLELAKLKYQLLGKGGSGGGRRSGGKGGSGGMSAAQQLQAQYSAQQSSGYNSLGNTLSGIYRS
jgi:hypothetical protein